MVTLRRRRGGQEGGASRGPLVLACIFAIGLGFWAKSQLDYNQVHYSHVTELVYTLVGESNPFCPRNPYIPVLKGLDHVALQKYGKDGLDAHALLAKTDPAKNHDHTRFRVFEELASCLDEACIGGSCGSDTSKIMCGLSTLNSQGGGGDGGNKAVGAASGKSQCVVYSVGGNNQWEFEVDILARTTCEVHTFDCTGAIERFVVPPNDGRLHFHHECLHGGTEPKPGPNFLTLSEMTQKYKHTQIDLFKMDVEGFEWGVFDAFHQQYSIHKGDRIKATADIAGVLPMQILVEIHYKTQFPELFPDTSDWKFEEDMISLARQLFEMGYIVVKHDDNSACNHCVELTLVRAYC